MRRRLTLAILTAAVAAIALVAAGVWGTGRGGDGSADETTVGLAERNIDAGQVDIKIEPTQLDAQGAVFKVTLDTHAVELSMDIAATAQLDVGGTAWEAAAWTGDGPGGHHREGELRFTSTTPPQGSARLTLSGFPEPVQATWDLGS